MILSIWRYDKYASHEQLLKFTEQHGYKTLLKANSIHTTIVINISLCIDYSHLFVQYPFTQGEGGVWEIKGLWAPYRIVYNR